ncbi:MAG: hypothetical protein ACK5MQ_08535 [Pikeienuella sp.]
MSKHVADDRTDHMDARVLKHFAKAEQKEAGAPSEEAKALHRGARVPDQSRLKQYMRIERGRSA